MKCLAALLMLTTLAIADGPPIVGHETIVIEGWPPVPKVQAKPQKRYLPTGTLDDVFLRVAPAYSDIAIEKNTWTQAWMLLDIDQRGRVTRVKFLKYPGYDLEKIAVKTALAMTFEPALDASGAPARSYLVFPIEWPTYGWLIAKTGLATGIPDTSRVPCRGSGPLNLDRRYPTYRDCTPPDFKKANTELWFDGARSQK